MSIEKTPVFSLKVALTPISLSLSIKVWIVSSSVIVTPRSIPFTVTPILPALTPKFINFESFEAVVV